MSLSSGEMVTGGAVLGTGTINGNITLTGGTMQPGGASTPGTLTINGDYSHANAAFNELISSGGNGLLIVNGNVDLGLHSLLNIDLTNGFTPTFGETFTLMDFNNLSGTFPNAPESGFRWTASTG